MEAAVSHLEDNGGGIYEDDVGKIYDSGVTSSYRRNGFLLHSWRHNDLLLEAWLPPRPVVVCGKPGGVAASTPSFLSAWCVVVVVVQLVRGRGDGGEQR
jgi:hypothetical protein